MCDAYVLLSRPTFSPVPAVVSPRVSSCVPCLASPAIARVGATSPPAKKSFTLLALKYTLSSGDWSHYQATQAFSVLMCLTGIPAALIGVYTFFREVGALQEMIATALSFAAGELNTQETPQPRTPCRTGPAHAPTCAPPLASCLRLSVDRHLGGLRQQEPARVRPRVRPERT